MASGNLSVFVPSPSKLGNVEPSMERYFGQGLEAANENAPVHRLIELQRVSMRLYESRIASMQRLVSFFVMFHSMGKGVQDFWSTGVPGAVGLGYEMDRTHSIMRIATTASPVSGAALRERIKSNLLDAQYLRATNALRTLVHIWLYGYRAVFSSRKEAPTPKARWQGAGKAVVSKLPTPKRPSPEPKTDESASEESDAETALSMEDMMAMQLARNPISVDRPAVDPASESLVAKEEGVVVKEEGAVVKIT